MAWVFGAAAGWPAARRRRVAEVIERHMLLRVDVEKDPEGHLLELSTGMDVSGRRTEELPSDFRAEVLVRYPRLGLAEEFVGHFEEQAKRKPSCLAAKFVRRGFATMVRANPLDRKSPA